MCCIYLIIIIINNNKSREPAVFFFISGGRSKRERKIRVDTLASFPCHEGMCSMAAGHVHGMKIIQLYMCYCFVKLVPTLASCCDRELIQNNPASTY